MQVLLKKEKKMFKLWFRKAFQLFIENKIMTAALRPGNRIFPNAKGTKVGEIAKIQIIVSPGDDERKIKAVILDSFEIFVRIKSLTVKKIGELSEEDFVGMSPDCQSKDLAKLHLGLIYNRIFTEDDPVTIIRWKYENSKP